MLATYSRYEINILRSEKEANTDRRSYERQTITNPSGDDFRTLPKTNSVGNSDMTSKTIRMRLAWETAQ